jgi:hypothetical protein
MLNFIRKFVASKVLNAIPLVGTFAKWLATSPGARRYVALLALTVKLAVAAVASVIVGVCQPFADLVGAVCSVDVNSWSVVASNVADKVGTWLNGGADLTTLVLLAWSYFEHKEQKKD